MVTKRARVWPGAWIVACAPLLATPPANGAGWLSCNAEELTPPASIEREAPPYPESARLAGAEGFVEIAFTVLRDGRVGWVRILRAEPSGFFEAAALDGVRSWRFDAAWRDGEPVECRIQARVRFTLADTVAARPANAPAVPSADSGQPTAVFPEAARLAALEGYVETQFTVDADGRVESAEVIIAMPRGEFEAAALAAVRQWRFPPAAGGPRTITRRFDFSLPGSGARTPGATLLAAAPLPLEACTRQVAGRVRLEVMTDGGGRITSARILDSSPVKLFDATALAIARNSRMAPAYRAGEPIAALALLTLKFEPDAAHCPGDTPDGTGPRSRSAPAPTVSFLPRFVVSGSRRGLPLGYDGAPLAPSVVPRIEDLP